MREYSVLKAVFPIKGKSRTYKGRSHKFLQGKMIAWFKQTFGLPVQNWLVTVELGIADCYAPSQLFKSRQYSHKFTIDSFSTDWLAFWKAVALVPSVPSSGEAGAISPCCILQGLDHAVSKSECIYSKSSRNFFYHFLHGHRVAAAVPDVTPRHTILNDYLVSCCSIDIY